MNDLNFKKTAALDLTRHLNQRIATVLEDFMGRCCVLGIEYETATSMALTVLSHHTACAARGNEATDKEFLSLCHLSFQKAGEQQPTG